MEGKLRKALFILDTETVEMLSYLRKKGLSRSGVVRESVKEYYRKFVSGEQVGDRIVNRVASESEVEDISYEKE